MNEVERVADLLGGKRVFRRRPKNAIEAHEIIRDGIPGSALAHLVGNFRVLRPTNSLEKAMGMSLRTFQRRKDEPSKPLNQEQSGRAWKFAEILAKATDVLGSQEAAEEWLAKPAIGLDRHRPLDLLATPAGVQLVEDYLGRLRYGVYT
jgi:putative toxin-antitoxin system antitoxin component (TIGR02293 family)